MSGPWWQSQMQERHPRYAHALAIVNDHVTVENRRGGAKPAVIGAVMHALDSGLDEQLIIDALEIYQRTGPPYSSYDLSGLLDATAKVVAKVRRAQAAKAESKGLRNG